MVSVPIVADGPIFSRLSIEYLAGAGPDWFQTSAKDRTDGGYVGREVRIIGGDSRTILSYSGGKYYVSPWTTIPTGMGYEIHTDPAGSGVRWRFTVRQEQSPLGNGSWGSLVMQYDRSLIGDWSDPVDVAIFDPPGTPGQNKNDAAVTFFSQVFRQITTNDLRTPPRPQDGNLFVPPPHNGTDLSNLDVGPEFVRGRVGVIPAPWSILDNDHTDAWDSAGNLAHYMQRIVRVMDNTPGAVKADYLIRPGMLPFKFAMLHTGVFGIEDDAGNVTPLNARGTWQPSFKNSGNTTYLYRAGLWHRTGDVMTCWGRIHVDQKDPSMADNVTIVGLPLPASVGVLGFGVQWGQIDGIALSPGFNQLYAKIAGAELMLTQTRFDGGNADYLPASGIRSGTNIDFTVNYRVG